MNTEEILKKLKEIKISEYNNITSGEEKSPVQVETKERLPIDEDLAGEEVKPKKKKGEKIPDRGRMSRTTSMDGKSTWSKAKKDYEFDASIKAILTKDSARSREQLGLPPLESEKPKKEYVTRGQDNLTRIQVMYNEKTNKRHIREYINTIQKELEEALVTLKEFDGKDITTGDNEAKKAFNLLSYASLELQTIANNLVKKINPKD